MELLNAAFDIFVALVNATPDNIRYMVADLTPIEDIVEALEPVFRFQLHEDMSISIEPQD